MLFGVVGVPVVGWPRSILTLHCPVRTYITQLRYLVTRDAFCRLLRGTVLLLRFVIDLIPGYALLQASQRLTRLLPDFTLVPGWLLMVVGLRLRWLIICTVIPHTVPFPGLFDLHNQLFPFPVYTRTTASLTLLLTDHVYCGCPLPVTIRWLPDLR